MHTHKFVLLGYMMGMACGEKETAVDTAEKVEDSNLDADGDGVDDSLDCMPENPDVYPGATDMFGDGIDQNCDGFDGVDTDGDGVASLASGGEDCDDNDATSTIVSIDADCDGVSTMDDCDDNDATIGTIDDDGDGYLACIDDCDDSDATIYPNAHDIGRDGIDQDCDGVDSNCVYTDCDITLDIGAGQGLDFVLIPAGTFMMGSPIDEAGRRDDEAQREVTLSHDFYVMTTEVTQGMFFQLMGYQAIDGINTSSNPGTRDAYPAYFVNWHMAADFANAATRYHNTLYNTTVQECYTCEGVGIDVSCVEAQNPYVCTGYRLLTEAEWEYAARAGDSAAFWTPMGNGYLSTNGGPMEILVNGFDLREYAWFYANHTNTSHPVAELLANSYGLYDMSGNVSEWTHDCYYSVYPTTPITDPVFEFMSVAYRSFRGGYWKDTVETIRSAHRDKASANSRTLQTGFRIGFIP